MDPAFFPAFLAATALLARVPGANVVLIISTSIAHGPL